MGVPDFIFNQAQELALKRHRQIEALLGLLVEIDSLPPHASASEVQARIAAFLENGDPDLASHYRGLRG